MTFDNIHYFESTIHIGEFRIYVHVIQELPTIIRETCIHQIFNCEIQYRSEKIKELYNNTICILLNVLELS